jgi:hypothetical protein
VTEIGRSITAVASVAACMLWIVGIIHILSKKHSVDQEIQAHDEGRMQGGRAVASSPPLPSVPGSASRGWRGRCCECSSCGAWKSASFQCGEGCRAGGARGEDI